MESLKELHVFKIEIFYAFTITFYQLNASLLKKKFQSLKKKKLLMPQILLNSSETRKQ